LEPEKKRCSAHEPPQVTTYVV